MDVSTTKLKLETISTATKLDEKIAVVLRSIQQRVRELLGVTIRLHGVA